MFRMVFIIFVVLKLNSRHNNDLMKPRKSVEIILTKIYPGNKWFRTSI